MIVSIIGSILFSMVLSLYVLLALGLPFGEYAMGGKHKILPRKERITVIISIMIQAFAILILLHCGRVISVGFPDIVARVFCYVFAGYLSLNVLMNLLSKSKKEKLFMTPVSIVLAVCFWVTALNF